MSDSAATIPGIYWQIQRLVERTVDHSGVPALIGPVGEAGDAPVQVDAWSRFRQHFGDGSDAFRLGARGYFANGGGQCVVVPVGPVLDAKALAAALEQLVDTDDISLVLAPGVVSLDLQAMIVEHCDALADRFAVLDVPEPERLREAEAVTHTVQHATDLRTRTGSSNVALYGPWLKVMTDDGPRFVPPSGHVAGVYVRVDRSDGHHRAPANQIMEDVVDLRFDFSTPAIAQMYPPLAYDAGGRIAEPSVNIIRALPGRGIRIWGARTLSADPAWRHVPVRRQTIDLERWMTRFLDTMVFEVNDALLRIRVVRELSAHLDRLYQRGALVGPISELAWSIQCDETNNPPDVVDSGMLIADVAIAPAVPGEFITLRLITRSGADAQTETLAT